jgi:nucleoside-diphosphate-sugar epimerase
VEGGNQKRVFTYVDDLIRGLMLLIKQPKFAGKDYNITGNEEISIRGLALHVARIIPGTRLKITGTRRLDRSKVLMNNSGAEIGYYPQWTLDRGLKELKAWISNQ